MTWPLASWALLHCDPTPPTPARMYQPLKPPSWAWPTQLDHCWRFQMEIAGCGWRVRAQCLRFRLWWNGKDWLTATRAVHILLKHAGSTAAHMLYSSSSTCILSSWIIRSLCYTLELSHHPCWWSSRVWASRLLAFSQSEVLISNSSALMAGIPLPAYQRKDWLFQRCCIFLHPATVLF